MFVVACGIMQAFGGFLQLQRGCGGQKYAANVYIRLSRRPGSVQAGTKQRKKQQRGPVLLAQLVRLGKVLRSCGKSGVLGRGAGVHNVLLGLRVCRVLRQTRPLSCMAGINASKSLRGLGMKAV